jgi:flagellar biosynthesis GTPase FlhF
LTATAEDVERTARDTARAQWGVAGVVMVGSMAGSGLAFHYLGEPAALGVLIALAVDLALATWLRISSRLRAVGLTSRAGWVLEVITAVQTLYLNVGAAVFRGIDQDSAVAHWCLGIAHSFLPIDLVLFSLASAGARMKLLRLQRDTEAADRAERDRQLAAERAEFDQQQRERRDVERRRANGELITAQDALAEAQRLRHEARQVATEETRLRELAEQERDAAEAAITATQAAAEKLAKQQRKTTPNPARSKKSIATPDERRQWIREQRAAGNNPSGADVDREFGPPKSGWRLVKQVEEEIDAELTRELKEMQHGMVQ